MLEIKSEWTSFKSNDGVDVPCMHIFMTRDGQAFNTSMVAGQFEDAESAVKSVTTMIRALMDSCYPELRDPIYGFKKRIEQIDKERINLEAQIKTMEEARAKGTEPQDDECPSFCDYKSCRISFIDHHHIDEHTITFNKPEDQNA